MFIVVFCVCVLCADIFIHSYSYLCTVFTSFSYAFETLFIAMFLYGSHISIHVHACSSMLVFAS